MGSARHPPDEIARLAALKQLKVLDTKAEAEFDAIVRAASLVCDAPISLVSLIDSNRQWFKANVGLPGVTETSRDVAFCAHAILGSDLFEVPDATLDPRFHDNPLVAGHPDVRFYAGAPLRLSGGANVGTLCVIDRRPRQLTENQREILRSLAVAASHALEGRRAIHGIHEAAVEMSHRAAHDALTGLANRTELEFRLTRTIQKARKTPSERTLLYIDLDQFRLVNDACGHTAGDLLLQQVARILGDIIRIPDTLARLGSDEFAIILENCNVSQAQKVAQQICDQMEEFRFVHEGRRFRIGASIGVVPLDEKWASSSAILQAGDAACSSAKEAGRNRVHTWFDSDMAMRARRGELQWAARIEQALDEDRFLLFAQRILPLKGVPHGVHAEVVLRLTDQQGTVVMPSIFMPAAERFHLASRIDRWVIRNAVNWLNALPTLDVVDHLGINLSGQSIGDRVFHRWAIGILHAAGPDICRKICLEITETSTITNLGDAAFFFEQVRSVGVKVALDDFGAGASSFGYLKTLSVDFLKIDGQFIRNLVDDPLDEVAVRCFIDVAEAVGMKTVAEFVDRPEVLARLRELGVDYAQGFLLHHPAPIDELLSPPVFDRAALN